MYRILCLTTGEYIKINSVLSWTFQTKIPDEICQAITQPTATLFWANNGAWEYLEFNNKDAAQWFITHRLVYNPRRKDKQKIQIMRSLFEINNIIGCQTAKLEFEIEEI